MSNILAITNRKLCQGDFYERIQKIVQNSPWGIVLREKDLSEEKYKEMAEKVLEICEQYGIRCMLHSYWKAAEKLGCERIHLPLQVFEQNYREIVPDFKEIGISVHSVWEAQKAEQLGASYLTAGHVFATDCKKGMSPRGLGFLKEVCQAVKIPVFAIGGMSLENAELAEKAGAFGICMMSGVMR